MGVWRLAFVTLALLTSGCDTLTTDRLVGDWQLEAGIVDDQPIPMAPGHRITMSIDADAARGTAACNSYGGKLSLAGGRFSLTEVGGTAMLCENPIAMESEGAYLAALLRVDRAQIVTDRLVLTGSGVELRFVRVTAASIRDVIDRVWVLESLTVNGVAVAARGDRATFELGSDGSIRGSTGCRAMSGTFLVRGDEILAPTGHMLGNCSPELQEQDTHVVAVILDRFAVRVAGETLEVVSRHPQSVGLGMVYRLDDGQ